MKEKVEGDLANVAFFLEKMRVIDQTTKVLLQDQSKDKERLKEVHKNMKIFAVIFNRMDPNSPG